jgi:SAM-dependent methyltransferase
VAVVPPGQGEAHRHREVAESFGSDAARYDRTRPRYPAAMVERIVASTPGGDFLDVGCGTGIEARQFRDAGCRVLAVEPDPRMADQARAGGIEVEVATFEAWDPRGRTFDAVIAGQSWHWVDPLLGASKGAQVLRPGGRISLFWHVFQPPAEVAAAFVTAYQRVVPDSPFDLRVMLRPALETYQKMFTTAADGIRQVSAFGDPEQWRFDWERPYSRDEWLDLVPTQGPLTRLAPGEVAQVVEAVGAAIDAIGGSFTMSYATVVVTAVRSGEPR